LFVGVGGVGPAGNYPVFGIKPGTQIYKFASAGAKREEFRFFGLFLRRCFDDLPADWTSVFHTKILITQTDRFFETEQFERRSSLVNRISLSVAGVGVDSSKAA